MNDYQKKLSATRKYRKTPKGILTNMYHHMKSRHKVDFCLEDFHQLFLENRHFLILFKNWVKSDYKKQLIPSLDRIDNKKHYALDNIQMMTWEKNRLKQSMVDGKKGRKGSVLQFLDGKLIGKFQSQYDVVKKLKITQGNLSNVLNGKRKHVNGFEFKWEATELLGDSNV